MQIQYIDIPDVHHVEKLEEVTKVSGTAWFGVLVLGARV